jgi:predicted transglutaminase-like cysteine proteinase
MAQHLTEELWADLVRINKEVNSDIRYKLDMKQYGQDDYWTVVEGEGEGDCEDYAMTKILRLSKETDWDRENLLLAACYVEGTRGRPGRGEGHGVCVARTDKGDYVLDNRHTKVMPYNDLPYKWIMMEDYANKRWVRIIK